MRDMSPVQNLWLTIFNFGPALILGIYRDWLVAIIALIATVVLSWILMKVVTANLTNNKAMMVWAWAKPPLVAALVTGTGLWIF